jgi:hypothetical protein
MIQLFIVLLMIIGWGFGQAMAPVLYPDHPETWLFVKAFCAGALSGLFWFFTEASRRRSP